jgi:hypothetical protein
MVWPNEVEYGRDTLISILTQDCPSIGLLPLETLVFWENTQAADAKSNAACTVPLIVFNDPTHRPDVRSLDRTIMTYIQL